MGGVGTVYYCNVRTEYGPDLALTAGVLQVSLANDEVNQVAVAHSSAATRSKAKRGVEKVVVAAAKAASRANGRSKKSVKEEVDGSILWGQLRACADSRLVTGELGSGRGAPQEGQG